MPGDKLSVVTLATSKDIVVRGTPEQVVDRFKQGHLVAGLARLQDETGATVWVNPAHVVSVADTEPTEPLAAS
jgi:hypothetical protein